MQPKSKVVEEKHHYLLLGPFYFRVIVIKIHKIIHNHSFLINSYLVFSVILCQLFKEQNNYITFFCAPPFLSEPLSYLSRPCGSSKSFSLLPCLFPFWPNIRSCAICLLRLWTSHESHRRQHTWKQECYLEAHSTANFAHYFLSLITLRFPWM